jgi:hypothetical protein
MKRRRFERKLGVHRLNEPDSSKVLHLVGLFMGIAIRNVEGIADNCKDQGT